MAWAAVAVGGGSALLSTGMKFFEGNKQKKAAQQLREQAVDPGIKPNQELRRVNNTLYDRYTNYNLPGYSRYAEQIKGTGANSMAGAIQGASSSGDILAAVAGNQSMQNNALNDLNQQQVSGEEQALMSYLNSLNQVGEDNVRVNNLENQRYDQAIGEATQLEGASTTNKFNALNELTTTGSAIASSYLGKKTGKTTPTDVSYQSPYN